jgi:hypothetical protein
VLAKLNGEHLAILIIDFPITLFTSALEWQAKIFSSVLLEERAG